MPTPEERPENITTDRLAAGIRTGIDTQPDLAASARPIANRLATLTRSRLPAMTATDTGALMIHLGAFISAIMPRLIQQGLTAADAVKTVTSAIAMAGVGLYDSDDTRCDSHAHPEYVGDQQIRCEQPKDHHWHRNGQRTWTP